MQPMGERAGTGELLACLTLVAPSGLTASDRDEWVRVAKMTLTGIPGDLLRLGCKAARETCRFPSEIVPTIMAAVEQRWKWRIEDAARPPRQHIALPSQEPDESPLVDPAEVRKLIQSIGGGE